MKILEDIRSRKNTTARGMADCMGITVDQLQAIERGEGSLSTGAIKSLARAYQLDYEDINQIMKGYKDAMHQRIYN